MERNPPRIRSTFVAIVMHLSFIHPLFLDDNRWQALGVLNVDGLHVAVQLLLGTLLVVTLAGNADAHTVGDALDALLPDLLVQLGVQTDVGGALLSVSPCPSSLKICCEQ